MDSTSTKYHPLSFIDRTTCPITFENSFYDKYRKWNFDQKNKLSTLSDSIHLQTSLSEEIILIEQMYSDRILSHTDPLFYILVNALNQRTMLVTRVGENGLSSRQPTMCEIRYYAYKMGVPVTFRKRLIRSLGKIRKRTPFFREK